MAKEKDKVTPTLSGTDSPGAGVELILGGANPSKEESKTTEVDYSFPYEDYFPEKAQTVRFETLIQNVKPSYGQVKQVCALGANLKGDAVVNPALASILINKTLILSAGPATLRLVMGNPLLQRQLFTTLANSMFDKDGGAGGLYFEETQKTYNNSKEKDFRLEEKDFSSLFFKKGMRQRVNPARLYKAVESFAEAIIPEFVQEIVSNKAVALLSSITGEDYSQPDDLALLQESVQGSYTIIIMQFLLAILSQWEAVERNHVLEEMQLPKELKRTAGFSLTNAVVYARNAQVARTLNLSITELAKYQLTLDNNYIKKYYTENLRMSNRGSGSSAIPFIILTDHLREYQNSIVVETKGSNDLYTKISGDFLKAFPFLYFALIKKHYSIVNEDVPSDFSIATEDTSLIALIESFSIEDTNFLVRNWTLFDLAMKSITDASHAPGEQVEAAYELAKLPVATLRDFIFDVLKMIRGDFAEDDHYFYKTVVGWKAVSMATAIPLKNNSLSPDLGYAPRNVRFMLNIDDRNRIKQSVALAKVYSSTNPGEKDFLNLSASPLNALSEELNALVDNGTHDLASLLTSIPDSTSLAPNGKGRVNFLTNPLLPLYPDQESGVKELEGASFLPLYLSKQALLIHLAVRSDVTINLTVDFARQVAGSDYKGEASTVTIERNYKSWLLWLYGDYILQIRKGAGLVYEGTSRKANLTVSDGRSLSNNHPRNSWLISRSLETILAFEPHIRGLGQLEQSFLESFVPRFEFPSVIARNSLKGQTKGMIYEGGYDLVSNPDDFTSSSVLNLLTTKGMTSEKMNEVADWPFGEKSILNASFTGKIGGFKSDWMKIVKNLKMNSVLEQEKKTLLNFFATIPSFQSVNLTNLEVRNAQLKKENANLLYEAVRERANDINDIAMTFGVDDSSTAIFSQPEMYARKTRPEEFASTNDTLISAARVDRDFNIVLANSVMDASKYVVGTEIDVNTPEGQIVLVLLDLLAFVTGFSRSSFKTSIRSRISAAKSFVLFDDFQELHRHATGSVGRQGSYFFEQTIYLLLLEAIIALDFILPFSDLIDLGEGSIVKVLFPRSSLFGNGSESTVQALIEDTFTKLFLSPKENLIKPIFRFFTINESNGIISGFTTQGELSKFLPNGNLTVDVY